MKKSEALERLKASGRLDAIRREVSAEVEVRLAKERYREKTRDRKRRRKP